MILDEILARQEERTVTRNLALRVRRLAVIDLYGM